MDAPPAAAADLVSKDRTAGLIVAGITGDESQQQTYAKELSDEVARGDGDVTVRSGGTAMVNVQITDQSQRDLLLMESIAIPLSFLVLVWVFGGLVGGRVARRRRRHGHPGRTRGAAHHLVHHRRVDLRAEPHHGDGSRAGDRLHAADDQPLPRRVDRRREPRGRVGPNDVVGRAEPSCSPPLPSPCRWRCWCCSRCTS